MNEDPLAAYRPGAPLNAEERAFLKYIGQDPAGQALRREIEGLLAGAAVPRSGAVHGVRGWPARLTGKGARAASDGQASSGDLCRRLNGVTEELYQAGNYAMASGAASLALRAGLAELGEEHPDTLSSLNNLAGCLEALGRAGEALPHYEQAVAGHRRVLGEEHPDTLSSLNNLAACFEALGRVDEAAERWREQATALRGLPQPGGVWLKVFGWAAPALADHARAGRITDWPALFAGLRETLTEVTDLLDPEQWAVARETVAAFHAGYLGLCLDLGRADLMPRAVAGVQGRKLASLVLEELDRRAEAEGPESLAGRYHAVRVALRQLALGLQVKEGGRMEPGGRPQRSASAEAELARERLPAYRAKLAEFRALREPVAAADPDGLGGARDFTPTLADLQAGLGREAALVLLMVRDPQAAASVVALVIRSKMAEIVPPWHGPAGHTHRRAGGRRYIARRAATASRHSAAPHRPRGPVRRSGRRGRSAGAAGPIASPLETLPRRNIEAWLRMNFWAPLGGHLGGVREVHLVTQGVSTARSAL